MANGTALIVDSIPIVLIGIQLGLRVCRLFQYLKSLGGLWICQQLGRCLYCAAVYLSKEAQP